MTTIGLRLLSDKRVAEPLEKVSRELRQAKAVGQLTLLTIGSKIKSANAPATELRVPVCVPSSELERHVLSSKCRVDIVECLKAHLIAGFDGS